MESRSTATESQFTRTTSAGLVPAALDKAWKAYNHGSVPFGAAVSDLVAAGVTHPEAEGLLDSPRLPSESFLAGAR